MATMDCRLRVWAAAGLLFLFVAAAVAQTPAPSPLTPPLTLSAAVAEALRSSPRLRAAAAAERQAQAAIGAARAGRLPQLDAQESFTRSDNPVTVFGTLLNQQGFTAADFALTQLNQPAPLNDFQTQISARVPLFDAGQAELRQREATLGVALAGSSGEQTRQAVISAVIGAFYHLSASQAAVAVAESAATTAASGLKMADARYNAGMVVVSDQLSAQAYAAQTQADLVAARNRATAAAEALNRELGRPLGDPVTIIAASAPDAAPEDSATLAALLTTAGRQRPELREQQDRVAIASTELRRARAAFLPQLDGMAAWQRDQMHFTGAGGSNWTLGLTLRVNLFRGGADRAAVTTAQAQRARRQAELDDLRTGVDLQVRQAWLAVDTARQQVTLARQVVEHATAALAVVQTRYNSGLATISDLLRTETELTEARTRLLNAGYDIEVSQANRALAAGELTSASAVIAGAGR